MPGLGAGRPSHAGGSALQLFVVGHQISPAQPDEKRQGREGGEEEIFQKELRCG